VSFKTELLFSLRFILGCAVVSVSALCFVLTTRRESENDDGDDDYINEDNDKDNGDDEDIVMAMLRKMLTG
jgi:hypothetical protein